MLDTIRKLMKDLEWLKLRSDHLGKVYTPDSISNVAQDASRGQVHPYLRLVDILDNYEAAFESLDRDGYKKEEIFGRFAKGPIRTCEARALYALIRYFRCKRVLEIGTGPGFSGLHFCRALRDSGLDENTARVDSIDVRDINTHPSSTLPLLKRDQLAGYFHFHLGRSEDQIPLLNGPYDFCLIDGFHTYEQTRLELDLMWNKLTKGAILAFHDVYDRPPEIQGPNRLIHELRDRGEAIFYFASDVFEYFALREDRHEVVRVARKWRRSDYSYVEKNWDPRCLMAVLFKTS